MKHQALNLAEYCRFIFLLLLCLPVFKGRISAQNSSDTIRNSPHVIEYIEVEDTIISIKLNVNSEYELFTVKGEDFYYDIRPNIALSSKISVNYRFISLGLGFTPKFVPGNNDNSLKGATKAFALGVNMMGSHWIQDLQWLHVRGFYLENTDEYDPSWVEGEDPYIQFPELDVIAYRGLTGYKLNENFSLKALTSQTEIQLKSCGSFIPYLMYNYYVIDNKTTTSVSSQKSKNFDAVISAGYAYTFVIRSKYYASLGINAGIGFQHTNLLTRTPEGDLTTKRTDFIFRSQEKIAFGYNSRKLFTGIEASFAQSTYNQGNTSVQSESVRTYFQIFIGYRFRAPWFIKHETDVIQKAIPFGKQE
jgi:hypothetical protein